MRISKTTGQISSILSIEQNENITKLTWLTIIYLGPALAVVSSLLLSPRDRT
jgi:Mg2+ and Co2+ transporter CorA